MKTSQLKPKKSLGQHFLTNEHVAQRVVEEFLNDTVGNVCLEVGPGKGVLTKYILQNKLHFFCCEIDERMASHIKKTFHLEQNKVLQQDILALDFEKEFAGQKVNVIGNFPYNISSQILFHVLDFMKQVPVVVGMFQKEMAMRVAAAHGNKEYGVITVLVQAYYDVEYLFDVLPEDFDPPPKVFSGVIKLKLKPNPQKILSEKIFRRLVKSSFQQRRKMMRNTLKEFLAPDILQQKRFDKRPEQLSVSEFIDLANEIYNQQNS